MAELEAAQATPKPAAAMVARGMGLYRHTTAVLAAFSLAAFAGHLWNIGWRGILEQLVGYWDSYVRPVTAWISHTLVSTPLSWAGLH
ncbi:MAG: hypothetical protein HOV83_07960, partial [Catenulispora sp.]|nr:hypothetical protein [Catenulispora sp.]